MSTDEAQRRLRQHGPNAVKEASRRSWLVFLGERWAPVPWMLEAAVALELLLGREGEAIAIAALLVFNALVSFAQEHRAQRALALLRERLSVQTRVRRDGRWCLVPAQELVPGPGLLELGLQPPDQLLMGRGVNDLVELRAVVVDQADAFDGDVIDAPAIPCLSMK